MAPHCRQYCIYLRDYHTRVFIPPIGAFTWYFPRTHFHSYRITYSRRFLSFSMSVERIPLDDFTEAFSGTTGALPALNLSEQPDRQSVQELSSVALGGKVLSVSDEFFAEAFHLLLVEVRA